MMKANGAKEWNVFSPQDESLSNFGNYGILILNRPIAISPDLLSSLWSKACWRITVDGGTDRWLDFVSQHSLSLPMPNYVTGDFDSIRPETLEFCQNHESIIVEATPDQDFTDFDKALNVLIRTCPQKLDCFVALAECSGRLDQTFSNVNTLCRSNSVDGYLLDHDSVSWLLKAGSHLVHVPERLRSSSAEYCGVLPLSLPAMVSSTGLKWNLSDSRIDFGGLISSSNTYDGSAAVSLTTDAAILWTMSYGNR